jgi:hypothetical protein
MSEDRQAFAAHMAELHRRLTCPLGEDRPEAIDGAAEAAEQEHQGPQEAAQDTQAVELWPGTDVPRNRPIWPGLAVLPRSDGASRSNARPVSIP